MPTMPAGGGSGDDNDKLWVAYFCVQFVVGGAFLLYALFYTQPSLIRATVDSATLSRLTVVSNNASAATVSYNLAVSLKLYNPGNEANIYYDAMDALLRFRGAVIGPAANDTSPSVFLQRSKAGRDVNLEFDYGRRGSGGGVSVDGDVAAELEKEMRSVGTVTMELELDVLVQVRFAEGGWKLREKPRIWCSMSIPVKADGRGALASGDRCRVKN
ncbi:unnamed protein product [Urochloa decumbens]|uniref:Late embryogenesis abundant protein LEA-2 subgroup domain-containing protein n=1 Tax=Urochloa decumbens TaxID=240449 RepID=A0ABC8VU85_9POAL